MDGISKHEKWFREIRWRLFSRKSLQRHVDRRLRLETSQWLFLLGVNNSGTTVLSQIIDSHSQINGMAPEGQHVSNVFPVGWQYGVARVWSEREDLFRWTEENPADALRAAYDWSWFLEPNDFLFEKSPPNTIRSRWLQRNFPGAFFLAIVRSPYAVCEGIKRRGGYTVERAARHWARANQIMLEDFPSLERKLLIRYEDLCSQPQQVLKQVVEFLGLTSSFSDDCLTQERTIHSVDHASRSLQNLNLGSISRLSGDEIATINEITGDVMAELGYETLSL